MRRSTENRIFDVSDAHRLQVVRALAEESRKGFFMPSLRHPSHKWHGARPVSASYLGGITHLSLFFAIAV